EPKGGQPDPSDLIAYQTRTVAVNRGGTDGGTVQLRFYEDMPNVPYISVADYHRLMLPGSSFTVTMTGTGLYALANDHGTATVDTRAETLTSPDIEAFTNMMDLSQKGMPNTAYDESPFVRWASIDYKPATASVTLDYSKYGIDLRGDGSSVFFPLATINDCYDDASMRHVAYNGEKIVTVLDAYHSSIATLEPDFYTPLAKETRPADMAEFNYRNLCFSLEHYYGYPSRSTFGNAMRNVGFDQALQDLGEAGEMVRTLLRSTNTNEYLSGLALIWAFLFDGGHSLFPEGGGVSDGAFLASFYPVVSDVYEKFNSVSSDYQSAVDEWNAFCDKWADLTQLRQASYGDGINYVKHGNTALCVFNSFMLSDIDMWKAYYAGTGPKPTIDNSPGDPFVILLDALNKAEADPEVENFIIDISTNTGGSIDIVVAITSLITGENYFLAENPLMGRQYTDYYDIDRNFDGKFDAADKDVKYHLNFALLESRVSFSCGNLLPSLLKDQGVLLIGETSGGGSCCVQDMSTADGYNYRISSHRARLLNAAREDIDKGVTPHVPISDYPDFYNIEKLSQIVNDWYK
ncbi:MAG: hypothetical protein J5593_02785, partial [Bacteroidaceae bacterium]|nr:hypothetical protein [Bacteroidaceae bacterium]